MTGGVAHAVDAVDGEAMVQPAEASAPSARVPPLHEPLPPGVIAAAAAVHADQRTEMAASRIAVPLPEDVTVALPSNHRLSLVAHAATAAASAAHPASDIPSSCRTLRGRPARSKGSWS